MRPGGRRISGPPPGFLTTFTWGPIAWTAEASGQEQQVRQVHVTVVVEIALVCVADCGADRAEIAHDVADTNLVDQAIKQT